MKMKISLSSVSFYLRKGPQSVCCRRIFLARPGPGKEEKNYSRTVLLCAFPEMKTSRKSVEALMVSMRWSFLFWWLRLDGVWDDMRSGHQTTASDKCTSLNKSSLRARRRCVEISFEISSVISNRFLPIPNRFSREEISSARLQRKSFSEFNDHRLLRKVPRCASVIDPHTSLEMGKAIWAGLKALSSNNWFYLSEGVQVNILASQKRSLFLRPENTRPEFTEFIHLVTHCEWTIKWMNFFPLWPRFFFFASSRLSPMV